MKNLIDRIRAAWAKIPAPVQSQIRHAVITGATAFAVTAKAMLPSVTGTTSIHDAKAAAVALLAAAVAAAARATLPLLKKTLLKAAGL